MNLVLPWPPTELSPNHRGHWAKVSKIRRAYRTTVAWHAVSQGAKPIKADKLQAKFVFYPPSRRRIDLDNCIARSKSLIDGLVDVLKVDDSKWVMSFEFAGQVGGMVHVEVSA